MLPTPFVRENILIYIVSVVVFFSFPNPISIFFIQISFIQKLEKPFIEAVKEVLQERYTDNMANIYNIIIKLILQTVAEGFEKDFD